MDINVTRDNFDTAMLITYLKGGIKPTGVEVTHLVNRWGIETGRTRTSLKHCVDLSVFNEAIKVINSGD